jgi:hypothetical protein
MREFGSEDDFRKWFETRDIYSKFGIVKILRSQKAFPDLQIETTSGKVIFAEVELNASNFDKHKHPENQVDLVITWLNDETYRSRQFKVLDVSFDLANDNCTDVDELLGSKGDLVYEHIQKLPPIAVKSINGRDFELIKRYRKAWKLNNQRDAEEFFTSDFYNVINEFKLYIEVSRNDFLLRTKAFKEWFPKRAFHPFLCSMAKAVIIRGTLQLIRSGIIPLRSSRNEDVGNIYAISPSQMSNLMKIENKAKPSSHLGSFPFLPERGEIFCTDYLDAFIDNFNFKAANNLPSVEIGLTLQELTIWEKFGKTGISQIEALKHYGLKEACLREDQFNPMKQEFAPSMVVSFSWNIAQKMKQYGFVAPSNSREIIEKLYDYVVQPMGVLTHADKMPNINDLEFFFYPQNRIDDFQRRVRTVRGMTKEDGEKMLAKFYQNYPSRFETK